MTAFGSGNAEYVLIQPVDEHDLAEMEQEVSFLQEKAGGAFLLLPVKAADWNRDLSPWPAPPVFGKEGFGDGARDMLRLIREEIIPNARQEYGLSEHTKMILGGYSLAGLFSLWCGHESSLFHGIAAASPSVWFPGFLDYARQRPIQTKAVYLSLGDREERTRNPVMRQVGDSIRALYAHYESIPDVKAALQWNGGNHFQDAGLRTAKAFAWVMDALR